MVAEGSTDNTADIVSKYVESDGRIRYIKPENKGVSNARKMWLSPFYETIAAINLIKEDRRDQQLTFADREFSNKRRQTRKEKFFGAYG